MQLHGRTRHRVLAGLCTAVWLSTGATLATVTAWALPLCLRSKDVAAAANGKAAWHLAVPRDWPDPDVCFASTSPASDLSRLEFTELLGYPTRWGWPTTIEKKSGWPFRCLSGWGIGEPPVSFEWHGIVAIGDHLDRANILLPYYPIWPGFALNTLFYAALAWGVWQVPLAMRRRSRRRAGKCARCGYDLRATPAGSPCPECGGGGSR
jgi:hypothetical protein